MFDEPNLLPHAGLAPLMALADRAGLRELLAGVRPGGPCGTNARTKVACLIAGMAAGADSIDDMDLLRDGAMETVFAGVRAPSTLGSHLRSYTWGNVRQLGAAHRALLAALARDPRLLPGRDVLAFVDVDSTQNRVYGYQKEGAAFGHAKVQGKSLLLKGLNPLISIISTPLAAPVLGPVRLRGGSAGSARGAASLAAEAIGTARDAGCTATIIARFDSAYCNAAVISAEAHFSVTVPVNSSIRAAIASRSPRPQYTAFTSKKKSEQVTARLTVRRVRAKNEKAAEGMDELFPVWRYHAVFTDSPLSSSRPRASTATTRLSSRSSPTSAPALSPTCHQVFSTRTPPGSPSPPWPVTCYAKARTATIRRDLVTMPARTRHGRGHLVLHLPEGHHREQHWLNLWTQAYGPPAPAA